MSEKEIDYEVIFKPYCLLTTAGLNDAIYDDNRNFLTNHGDDAFTVFKGIYNTHCGSIDVDENLISIHTGGWSENEEIIRAFKKTWWWFKYFNIQTTGSHYFFNTKNGSKEWKITKKEE